MRAPAPYGRYQDVFLTDEELADLRPAFPPYGARYIEKLSEEHGLYRFKPVSDPAATIRRWASASASGRAEEQRKGCRRTAAPHGAYQTPKGTGPARPLSVRLHICQRQRPKPLMDKAHAYVENWKGGIQKQHRPAVVWGCGNRQVLFSPVVLPTPCLTGMCRC